MNEQALAVRPEANIINFEEYAMSVDSVVKQVSLIQDVMKRTMKEGEHYGKIPGTDKPTLLKPGAEKLNLTFRFEPDYNIIEKARDKDFLAYTVKCTLTHIPTGQKVASGIGSCNSREAKYRYRWIDELTEEPIPKDYWKAKKAGDNKEMQRILGKGYRPRKNEETGQWVKAKSERVDNDNPWDLDNTLIKMACKRALIAANLNATAASDIFTQDIEDLQENGVAPQTQEKQEKKKDTSTSRSSSKATSPAHEKIEPPEPTSQASDEMGDNPPWNEDEEPQENHNNGFDPVKQYNATCAILHEKLGKTQGQCLMLLVKTVGKGKPEKLTQQDVEMFNEAANDLLKENTG